MNILFVILIISIGASIGAVLRWQISECLNPLLSQFPLGTLIVNWIGGLLIGLALGLFIRHTTWSTEWRLLTVTGFLGSLTTFSSFSADVILLLQEGRLGWATFVLIAHVLGSLLLTIIGFWFASQISQ